MQGGAKSCALAGSVFVAFVSLGASERRPLSNPTRECGGDRGPQLTSARARHAPHAQTRDTRHAHGHAGPARTARTVHHSRVGATGAATDVRACETRATCTDARHATRSRTRRAGPHGTHHPTPLSIRPAGATHRRAPADAARTALTNHPTLPCGVTERTCLRQEKWPTRPPLHGKRCKTVKDMGWSSHRMKSRIIHNS